MHKSTRHSKSSHPIKHLNGRHHHSSKHPTLTSQIKKIYSHSRKTVTKKPYQIGSVVLVLGISSVIFWYKFLK